MARIDKSEECWRWLGSHTGVGRPQVNFEGRPWIVYRLIYTWERGEIPPGFTIDHLCLNGWCCNPDHMEPVTNSVNIARGLRVRWADAQEACPSGHLRAEFGTLERGNLRCAECNRLKARRAYHANPKPNACEDCGTPISARATWCNPCAKRRYWASRRAAR